MATLDRKAEGIPKPLWKAAKTLHKGECRRRGSEPGGSIFPEFKDLPEWAIRAYLGEVKKIVKAYEREAAKTKKKTCLHCLAYGAKWHKQGHPTLGMD